MKSRLGLWSIAICLCVMVALSSQLTAQNNPQHHPMHHQYKLYDVGTFGGPNSFGSYDAISLTPAGAIGFADTADPDPYCWIDCMVGHGFLWRYGHLFDLGALPGSGNSSYAFAINNNGLVVGVSENGAIDPDTGYPSTSAVAWLNGHIFNLGGFGGTQGQAAMVNNRGQIAGTSSNTTPDPFGPSEWLPTTTELRAFVWENGRMRDIGTLGGPDAWALYIRDSGYVVGNSYINSTPNPDTGVPSTDAFLWDGHRMIDLGNFGTAYSWPAWVNNKGQVVGYSLVTSTVHAFLWDHGKLTDIGTPGGASSGAYWINEAGVITGFDNVSVATHGAVIWRHGSVTRIGNLPDSLYCAGISINEPQQVVGICYYLTDLDRGFLWENGDLADLNDLVQPPSDLVITDTLYIDERGQIMAHAADADGNNHTVVLVPNGDCDRNCEQRIAESRSNPHTAQPATTGTTMPWFGKAEWLRKPFERPLGILGPSKSSQ